MKKQGGTVGIKVGNIIDEVGSRQIWGDYFDCIKNAFPEMDTQKKFPLIMKKLYGKGIKCRDAQRALEEMNVIAIRLKERKNSEGVCLFELYPTSTKRNITLLILECIEAAINEKRDIKILSYDTIADIAFM